jgi:hypothetical protein
MTERTATTDAASSPKEKTDATHAAHGKLLTVTDAKGITSLSHLNKETTSVATKAMVGAGVIPPLLISERTPAAPAPKAQGFFGGFESDLSNFAHTVSKDTAAVAQKVESTAAFKAVAQTTENVVANVHAAAAQVAAKVESTSVYKAAAKETHEIVGATENAAKNFAASPLGKGLIHGAEAGASAASLGMLRPTPEQASKVMDFISTTGAATKDVAIGAYDEATQHPLDLAEGLIKGAGTALLAGAVITGAALIAPEAAVAATVGLGALAIGGLGYEAYKFSTHLGQWSRDAKVISNPNCFASNEVAEAHKDLQGVGAKAAIVGSEVIGALAAAPMATMAAGDAFDDLAASRAGSASTAYDVMQGALTSGRYVEQNFNGLTVLMPR